MTTERTENTENTSRTKESILDGLDAFTKAYLEAALWSSTYQICPDCESVESDGSDHCPACGERMEDWPIDKDFEISDCSIGLLEQAEKDCKSFQEQAGEWIADENLENASYPADERAGHDFWLTRNGHGCGFWDGDWTEQAGEKLTDLAKGFGEVDLYVSESADGEREVEQS